MRRMTATLVALATTAMALGFACGQAPTHGTVTVERQDFRVRVTADGVLEAVESTALAPPLNIRRPFTVAWIIDDGVAVKQGDVVVRFDAIEFEQQLERAMSERRTSQRRIDRSNTERDVTIEKLDLDAAMSQMELEHAESFQTLDTTVFSRMEILESSIDTELARHKADHALESKDIEAQLAQAEIDLHRIAQQRADLQISQAEDGLEHLEIIAPYDGLVVLEREWDGTPHQVRRRRVAGKHPGPAPRRPPHAGRGVGSGGRCRRAGNRPSRHDPPRGLSGHRVGCDR
jgi:HlyD family secretion protein